MDATAAPRSTLSSRLFGYDLFISFALGPPPRGSRNYASDLARKLRERDFTVFFSEDEAPVGGELDQTLKRGLRRAGVLIVIANRGTLEEPRWVRQEVEEFRRRHPQRLIVPISIDGALHDPQLAAATESWLEFRDRIWIDETRAAADSGIASDEVVLRLVTAPTSVRAAVRWRWLVSVIILALAGLAAAAVWSAWRAERAAAAEQLAATEARAAEGRATVAAAREAQAASAARHSESQAIDAAAKEAVAAAAARKAEREAVVQRDEAVRQRDMAMARQLAIHAERAASTRDAVRLAAESLHLRPFAETETLLRSKLALSPRAAHSASLDGIKTGPVPTSWSVWAFSPRGRYLAAGALGGPLSIIEVQSGRTVLQLTDSVMRAQFSVDETRLAVADNSRRAQLLKLADGSPLRIVDGEGDIAGFSFSADGNRLLVGLRTAYPGMGRQRNGFLLIDTNTGKREAEVQTSREVRRVQLSADGLAAYVETPGEVAMWRATDHFAHPEKLASGVRQWMPDPLAPGVLILDDEGRLQRAGANDPTQGRWNGTRVDAFATSEDGKLMAIAQAGAVTVVGRDGEPNIRMERKGAPDGTLQFLAGGRLLRIDQTLFEGWEPPPPRGTSFPMFSALPKLLPLVSSEVSPTAWSPLGMLLATPESPSGAMRAQFWHASAGDDLSRVHHPRACILQFSSDFQRLLTAGGDDGLVRVWAWADRRQVSSFEHPSPVTQAWFSPDGASVVSLGSGGGRWWRVSDSARLGGFDRPVPFTSCFRSTVASMAWPGGKPLMALPESLDRATVLDLSDGTVLASLPHPAGPGPAQDWHSLEVVLAPDGREAVTFNQNSPTPLLLHRLGRGSEAPVRLDAPDFPLQHLSFTDRHELVAQGRKLAQDPMLQRVWSLPSGRVVSTSTGGRGPANRDPGRPGAAAIDGALQQMLFADTPNRAFARSGDAHFLAAVREDDIRIYSTDTEELVQMACKRSLRGLSADEWRRYIGIVPARPACGPAN